MLLKPVIVSKQIRSKLKTRYDFKTKFTFVREYNIAGYIFYICCVSNRFGRLLGGLNSKLRFQ